MYSTKMLNIWKKTPLSLTLKHVTEYRPINRKCEDLSVNPQYYQCCQGIHLRGATKDVVKWTSRSGLLSRVAHRWDLYKKKYQLIALGYNLYDDIPDKLNYSPFFKGFNMPDTFFSWFLITELHVWMLMTRFMAEGATGKAVVNNIVEAMWHDILIRVDLLGPSPPRQKKKQIIEISEQFNAALIGYDEGIMSDDKVLAGALWRRFFGLECNNPEHLEKLVIYVRKQIHFFDQIPSEKLYHRSIAQWVDLQSIK